MNQPQPGFLPFPMLMGAGPIPSPMAPECPARVRAAMEFLQQLSFKQMVRGVATEHVIDVIPGQKLTTAEANAQASAANMLSLYFQGKLRVNFWEKLERDQMNTGFGGLGPGTPINCVNCIGGAPKSKCPLCKGSGNLIVFPGG